MFDMREDKTNVALEEVKLPGPEMSRRLGTERPRTDYAGKAKLGGRGIEVTRPAGGGGACLMYVRVTRDSTNPSTRDVVLPFHHPAWGHLPKWYKSNKRLLLEHFEKPRPPRFDEIGQLQSIQPSLSSPGRR